MRMLVTQSQYNNLKHIDDNDNNDEYGYFYDLDINDKIIIENIQLNGNSNNNITNNYINRFYIYNYIDQKKDDDITENENNEILEKYNDLYFVINIIFITAGVILLLYFVFTM